MTPKKHISISTTDTIPGETRAVDFGSIIWKESDTLKDAIDSLQDICRKYDYDAIVGLKIFPEAFQMSAAGAYHDTTHYRYLAYATCVKYKGQSL
jgi:uncharacterized protein YbjQ (UPF0145 family)